MSFILRSLAHLASRLGLGAAAALVVAAAGPPVAAQTTMKLATATVNDVQVEAIKRFGAKVEARSGGKIKAEYYPGAQLGSNPRMIEGLQLGTIEVYVGPPAYLVGIDSRFQVLDAPGIFDDAEHFYRVSQDDEFRKAFLGLGEKRGLVGVSLFLYSPTSYATRPPVRTLADFEGLKLRVLAAKMEREAVGRLGATAVPIDFSEVVSALQQGTIDGLKTGLSVFTSLKIYDVVKYVTETNEAMIPEVMMISKVWFDRQPEEIKKILIEEARAGERELFEWTNQAQVDARRIWQEKGGEIFTLKPEEQKEMMARMAKVADEVLGEKRQDREMFDLLKEALDRARRKS
jgi:TRAP-type C4-dicarboxylate transport system substrate-binding protein